MSVKHPSSTVTVILAIALATSLALNVIITTIGFPSSDPSSISEVSSSDYTIWVEQSKYFAKNRFGRISYAGYNFTEVINNCIDSISNGTIQLASGHYNVSGSIISKPGIKIRGTGMDSTTLQPTAGRWCVRYEQPRESIGVVFRPIWIEELSIRFRNTAGRWLGVLSNCSAYGGSSVRIIQCYIGGWNTDGTYGKLSTAPNIGVKLLNTWDVYIVDSMIVHPGVNIEHDAYIYLEQVYLDGGLNGNSVGIHQTAYRTRTYLTRVITEKSCVPVIWSDVNSLFVSIKDCHFEDNGWEPANGDSYQVLNCSYNAGFYDMSVEIDHSHCSSIAMWINRTHTPSIAWYRTDAEITEKVFSFEDWSLISGNPLVSWGEWGLKVDNTGQASEAVVDLLCFDLYSQVSLATGCYIKGEGECRFTGSYPGVDTQWTAYAIDGRGNLIYGHYDATGTGYTNVTVSTAGVGRYDIIGYPAPAYREAPIVYGEYYPDGYHYKSFLTHNLTDVGFQNIDRVRIVVPIDGMLEVYPRLYHMRARG